MRNMTISLKLVVPGIVLQSSRRVITTLADEGSAGISLLM